MLFAIPVILVFTIYVPLYLYFSIKSDIEESDNITQLMKSKYQYINGEFKDEYFYWELIRLAEKLAI